MADKKEIGTTEKLFPDLVVPEKPEVAEPPKKEEVKQEIPPVKEEPKKEEPPKEEPKPSTEDEYIDLEKLRGKKVRGKVDGVAYEKPIEDVVRGYQTDQHLTLKGQRLAEEAKRIESLKEVLVSTHTPEAEPDSPMKEDPVIKLLIQKVNDLEKQNRELADGTKDIRFKSNLEKLDEQLKTEGLPDFKNYIPKVKDYILSQPPEVQPKLDTFDGWASIYKDIKLRDVIKQIQTPAKSEERPAPKVVPIPDESSGRTVKIDDRQAKINTAMKEAMEATERGSLNANQLWAEVIRLKRETAET